MPTKNLMLFIFQLTIVLALGFALSTVGCGQGGIAPQSRGARPDAVQREVQRQFEMQMIEQALERPSRQVKRYGPLVLEQIRADFLRIQIVDRKLVKAAAAPNQLDLGLVARSAAEIKKRSAHLKKNLALPEPETTPLDRFRFVVEPGTEPLRNALFSLSNLIEEFVSNPMFEQTKLVESQLSAKARRVIEAIVELSGEIKRSSEKLKLAAKSP